MSTTAEQQDYQKSIIAFVAGLLIGGLVTWVFSAPAVPSTPEGDATNQAAAVVDAGATEVAVEVVAPTVGAAAVTVTNATAGDTVGVSVAGYPAQEGWVAVREVVNGVLANVLGASKYTVSGNKLPTEVKLYRNTVAGGTYRVVFYTADENFDLKAIQMVAEGSDFIAQ